MAKVDLVALKNGGFLPQKQKNKFSLRLHIVGGHATPEQLVVMGEVAKKYGSGEVHFTARQSVEIPFVDLEDVEIVKETLAKGGLAPAASGPRVRTITSCQGNAICNSGNIDAFAIAKELDRRYYGMDVPHKFKFGVTGCPNNCLKAEENDLGIKGISEVHWIKEKCIYCKRCEKTCRHKAITIEEDNITRDTSLCNQCGKCAKVCPKASWVGEPGFQVSFGGLFGNTISRGQSFLPIIKSEEQLFQVIDTALQFFKDHGKAGERFKFTMDRIGWDEFKSNIEEVL